MRVEGFGLRRKGLIEGLGLWNCLYVRLKAFRV